MASPRWTFPEGVDNAVNEIFGHVFRVRESPVHDGAEEHGDGELGIDVLLKIAFF